MVTTTRVFDVRHIRRTVAAAALASGLVLSQVAAGPASAADIPAPIEFTAPATVSTEYGEYWSFAVTPSGDFLNEIYNNGGSTVTNTGAPAGYTPDLSLYSPSAGTYAGNLSATYVSPPLGVGSYTFKITGEHPSPPDTYIGATTTSAQLTVTKAALGIDLRVIADPNHPESAVVSAQFTGRFVDEYVSSSFDYAAISPAGEWTITITDSAGDVAIERNFERSAGDDTLARSFYWTGGEADAEYTATATFSPSGASGANFTVAPSNTFSYTVPASVRPTPSSTAPAEAVGALPEASEFSLPLWALILAAVLIVGLGVLVTLFSLRLHRRSAVSTQGVAS